MILANISFKFNCLSERELTCSRYGKASSLSHKVPPNWPEIWLLSTLRILTWNLYLPDRETHSGKLLGSGSGSGSRSLGIGIARDRDRDLDRDYYSGSGSGLGSGSWSGSGFGIGIWIGTSTRDRDPDRDREPDRELIPIPILRSRTYAVSSKSMNLTPYTAINT